MHIVGISRFDILLTTFVAWFIAQGLKVLLGVLREKRFDFRWFVGTGGMPSSHAAAVSALTTAVGLHTGFASPSFYIAFVFTIVVLFDAQGVRRESGKMAEILNKVLDDIYWKKKIQEERLKELIGHTPIEVFTGTMLGIFVALIFSS